MTSAFDRKTLTQSVLELIRVTATTLPEDVTRALRRAYHTESPASLARETLGSILANVREARERARPICQDSGSLVFDVQHPLGISTTMISRAIRDAVVLASDEGILRANSIDPVTGKSAPHNIGHGHPENHFEECSRKTITIRLLMKGGGCENVSQQISLPDESCGASRSIEGCRRVILKAIAEAQGKGCAPGVIGVCIGGDRASGFAEAKRQLMRQLDDVNSNPALAKLEKTILREANTLGIGPMGLGGQTTILACKMSSLQRLPASYFVTVSYMCWALRRRGIRLKSDMTIQGWV